MRQWRKSRIVRLALGVALAIGAYALAGFVIAPRVLRSQLIERVHDALGLTPVVGEIRINPFLFQLEMRNVALPGADGEKLVGFDRLFVDFELSSIVHRAYTFRAIALDAPVVNARIARDGTLNLLQLKPRPPSPPPPPQPQESGALPALRVASLKVSRGSAGYDDRSRPTEFSARLEPIDFELRDFSTGISGGAFMLSGASQLGERFEWHGRLSVQPLRSDGEVRLEGLHARTVWAYLEDQLNFVVNSGTLDAQATYRFSPDGDTPDLKIEAPKLRLTDFVLRPRDGETDWVTLPVLEANGATLDLRSRQAHLERLSLERLKVLAWLEADRTLNLMSLAAPRTAAGAAPAAAPAAASPTAAAASRAAAPWKFDLATVELRAAAIEAEDRGVHPAAKAALAPLNVTVKGVSLDLAKPLDVALDAHLNGAGTVALRGTVTPQPVLTDLRVELANLDLTALAPYVTKFTGMALLGGRLGADATVHFGRAAGKPALQIAGLVTVDQLHTVDDALRDDFIDWQRLEVHGLNFQQSPDKLEIAEVVARKPYARVIIEPDASLNVKRVLAAPGSEAALAATDAPPPAPKKRARRPRKASAPAVASAPAPSAAPGMPMSIKKVTVHQGRVNFSDLTVQPNFSAGIEALEGAIVGLSSDPKARATVDLHGQVEDPYSPVAITGKVNLLSASLYTDVSMSFRNMELTIFNPYSGKFAGYDISKGKLTTELHYKVDGGRLEAQHHIVIDQLEFGNKTASKDAVSLPVKFAVALLKDRHGVIDLNLPVSGTLDDPSFRIGPIIWHVLVNLLQKAVTAPFALLGSLFGGGPDLQYVDFKPAVAALDDAGLAKLRTMAKGLAERPQLKVDVPIGFVADLDRPALLDAAFAARLEAAQGAPAPQVPFAQRDPAAQLAVLVRAYTQELGAAPVYPETVTGLPNKADVPAAKIDFLSQAIRAHLHVPDEELRALGERRATAVQQALLDGTQVDPSQVFLVANDKAAAKDGMVRLEMTLK